MKKLIIRTKPGVLIGLSSDKPCKGEAYFYDGDKLIFEVELGEPFPSWKDELGLERPGIELDDLFIKKTLSMKCPEGAEIEVFTAD